MWEKLKSALNANKDKGIPLPMAYDPDKKGPSLTLLMAWITFLLAIISTIVVHFKIELIMATGITLVFWCVATVLYLIRNLSKAKFDLDDKEIELESDENNKENK